MKFINLIHQSIKLSLSQSSSLAENKEL